MGRGCTKTLFMGVRDGMGAPRFLCAVMPVSCCGGQSLFVGGWSG